MKIWKFCLLSMSVLIVGGCHFYSFNNIERLRSSNPPRPPKSLSAAIQSPLAPLAKEILIGKWTATRWGNSFYYYDSDVHPNGPHLHTQNWQCIMTYEFYSDGMYVENVVRKYVSFAAADETSIIKGKWDYDSGKLRLMPQASTFFKGGDEKRKKLIPCRKTINGEIAEDKYDITWANKDEIAIWQSSKDFELSYQRNFREPTHLRVRNIFVSDVSGLSHHTRFVEGKDDGSIDDDCSVTSHYLRGDMTPGRLIDHICGEYYYPALEDVPKNTFNQSFPNEPHYRIVTCERESGTDFAYRFIIELGKDSDQTLAVFRKIQKEFRAAIQADYMESFPRVDRNALHVDFPTYKLNDGKVEGRAVVLTISVAALSYDPNMRKGKLAVRFNANQYEDARNWIRKNIETLARDKNIVLTTGEIPPAAKFYLGREELKNGNILEIEFITE